MDVNFWVGLYNVEEFNSENSCGCGSNTQACTQCQNKFKWVDQRLGSGYTDWRAYEPGENEKCVRLSNDALAGTLCTGEYGYICYKGKR